MTTATSAEVAAALATLADLLNAGEPIPAAFEVAVHPLRFVSSVERVGQPAPGTFRLSHELADTVCTEALALIVRGERDGDLVRALRLATRAQRGG